MIYRPASYALYLSNYAGATGGRSSPRRLAFKPAKLFLPMMRGFTCYPQQKTIGPMCNDAVWDALIGAMVDKREVTADAFGVSYMGAGEGTALGVSNSEPYARAPQESDDWVKEGPHLMTIVPGRSTDPKKDPVYVMWKNTHYALIMVKIAPE